MKSKILFQLFLLASLGIVFTTMKSDVNGRFNGGTSCGGGGCHPSSANTTVALTGFPTSINVGQTYNLTFTVSNTSMAAAGFNILCSSGTFNAGTGSKVNTAKTQITHTAPMNALSGVTNFNFSWTAPSVPSLATFSFAGNAVMINNNPGDDAWAANTTAVNVTFPAGVTNINAKTVQCYPNPTSTNLVIDGLNTATKNVRVYNMLGQVFTPKYTLNNNKCTIDCSVLSSGAYLLVAENNNQLVKTNFIKN